MSTQILFDVIQQIQLRGHFPSSAVSSTNYKNSISSSAASSISSGFVIGNITVEDNLLPIDNSTSVLVYYRVSSFTTSSCQTTSSALSSSIKHGNFSHYLQIAAIMYDAPAFSNAISENYTLINSACTVKPEPTYSPIAITATKTTTQFSTDTETAIQITGVVFTVIIFIFMMCCYCVYSERSGRKKKRAKKIAAREAKRARLNKQNIKININTTPETSGSLPVVLEKIYLNDKAAEKFDSIRLPEKRLSVRSHESDTAMRRDISPNMRVTLSAVPKSDSAHSDGAPVKPVPNRPLRTDEGTAERRPKQRRNKGFGNIDFEDEDEKAEEGNMDWLDGEGDGGDDEPPLAIPEAVPLELTVEQSIQLELLPGEKGGDLEKIKLVSDVYPETRGPSRIASSEPTTSFTVGSLGNATPPPPPPSRAPTSVSQAPIELGEEEVEEGEVAEEYEDDEYPAVEQQQQQQSYYLSRLDREPTPLRTDLIRGEGEGEQEGEGEVELPDWL